MSFSPAEQDYIISLIFVTTFTIIGFYNLLLFLSTKEAVYRDYTILIFTLSLFSASNLILPFDAEFANQFSIFSAGLTVVGSLTFVRTFLAIEQSKYSLLYNLYRWLQIVTSLTIMGFLLGVILHLNIESMTSLIIAFFALTVLILHFSAGVYLLNKDATAKLFLLTSLPLFMGATIYILGWLMIEGMPENEQLFTNLRLILYCSLTLQMALFSIVIGYRLNKLKLDQIRYQVSMNENLTRDVALKTAEIGAYAKKLEASNNLKNKLFTLLSHDIRNPLTSLIGVITVIEKNSMNPKELAGFLEDIKRKINTSVHTLGRILQWSSSQWDGFKIEQTPVSTLSIINEITSLFGDNMNAKNIQLSVDISEKQKILFDKEMFESVIRNIIANAIKFSHQNGELSIISIHKDDKILLSIEDKGIGMNDEMAQKIMAQKDHITTEGTAGEQGAGFGLLIAQDFLKMNHASLMCESKRGVGTKFTLILQPA